MKYLSAAILAALFVAATGFAALPPYSQRLAELEAILKNKDIEKTISSEQKASGVIDGLSTEKEDEYVVKSGPCELKVTIVDKKLKPGEKPIIGPRRFEVQPAQTLDCK